MMEELQRHHEQDVRMFMVSLVGIGAGVIVGVALPIAWALTSQWI
jgi:hypothetical protein